MPAGSLEAVRREKEARAMIDEEYFQRLDSFDRTIARSRITMETSAYLIAETKKVMKEAHRIFAECQLAAEREQVDPEPARIRQ